MPNILTNLLAYYQMEEAAGSAKVPSYGTGNLTDGNANLVARAAGFTGTFAASFVNTQYQWLDIPSTFFQGKNNWCISAWVKVESTTENFSRFLEFGTSSTARFTICWKPSTFTVVPMVAQVSGINASFDYPFAITAGEWTLITVNMNVNQITVFLSSPTNGTRQGSVGMSTIKGYTFAAITGTLRFALGGGSLVTSLERSQALIDSVMCWDRNVDKGTHEWLYNRGLGRTSAEILADADALTVPAADQMQITTRIQSPSQAGGGSGGGGGGSAAPTSGLIWPWKG
jgi:hypothetical protein